MRIAARHLTKSARFRTGITVGGLTGLALCAPAQSDPWASGSSSTDTFGGRPDSSAFIWIPSDTDDWTRHFHIGAMVGLNISAKFNEQGLFGISGNNPANGIYDDGYVHPDNTGNAFGQTGNWGYQNASQYNPATQTLLMHSTSSFSTAGNASQDSSVFVGFDMVYGGNLWYWKHARVGWEFGFGLLPIDIKDNSSLSATVNQTTYVFDTGGIIVPAAPYQGGFNRQGEPTISDIPSTSNQTFQNQTVSGSRELDVMLYTIKLGPSFYWDLTEHVGISLGAGPAVGFVTGDYKYNEVVTANGVSSRNNGSFGTTDFVFGGYANATVLYHVLDNADIYLGAQYMPLSNANFSNGGRQAQLDLTGQVYISAGISWPF